MAHAPEKLMTADELYELGDIGRSELIRGELIRMSPANPRHGVLVNFMEVMIDAHIRSRKLGRAHVRARKLGRVFGAETGFKVASDPDTVRAPDVAFVAGERGRSLPKRGFFDGAPDLAVEVVSPCDSWSDLQGKAQDWLDAGCQIVWIVDGDTEMITSYERGGTGRTFKRGDTLDGGSLLPGFQLPVASVFDELI
jgi:Uma2 family endonuclease